MPSGAREDVCLRILVLFVVAIILPANSSSQAKNPPAGSAEAQLSFASAIDLALRNSGKIKSAQEDVKKAAAALAVTKDIFIPSVVAGGGVGTAYGITLNVPTIFTINAQSLVYSAQQRFYIRAAQSDLHSAQLAMQDARDQVEEDTAVTYISIAHAENTLSAVDEQYNYATRLVSMVADRVQGKLDSELELMKARRTAVQLKLQKLRAQDDLASLRDHLGQLLGRPGEGMEIVPESVPEIPSPADESANRPEFPDSPAILSAQENAKGKRERAKADSIYTWRPQISFGAQYGRVSPIENVSQFYNLHNNYNSASIGIQIQFPLLDQVRRAAAAESTADALRSENELLGLKFDQEEEHKKLLRSVPELGASAELAELEQKIAETELNSTLLQMKQTSGGPLMTPKDEMNVRIQERQKFLDLLDARLQLAKAEISLLRQAGGLDQWLQRLPPRPQPVP
jgi:outer membrane protein TolC